MNIIVRMRQVPGTEAERSLRPDDSTVDGAGVINYLDEFAIEEALRIADAQGGSQVTILTGPGKATDSIRKALSMGADKAVHVTDDALAGADVLATSLVRAKTLDAAGFDLVMFGSEATDADAQAEEPGSEGQRLAWATAAGRWCGWRARPRAMVRGVRPGPRTRG